MADKALPCPTVLRLLLRYEPETGKLFWRERARVWFKTKRAFSVWNARYAGTEALAYKDNYGYPMGAVGRCRHMKAHRAAWTIVHGAYPDGDIDHINGVRDDNRISNLRATSHQENQRNLKFNRANKSGQVGVFKIEKINRWWAYIGSGRSRVSLGYFGTFEDAATARLAAQKAEGYHVLHGLTAEERKDLATASILRP